MLNTIQTVADLNKFVALFGSLQPEDIIDKLADKKLIISSEMARLILRQAYRQPEQTHQ